MPPEAIEFSLILRSSNSRDNNQRTMQAAFTVLTNPTLFAHIVDFQAGFPFAWLAFEPEVYAADQSSSLRTAAEDAAFLHHALLSDNVRMVELFFRLREQPYYAAMPRFALDGVLRLVWKRGSAQYLEWLDKQRGVPDVWPSDLLQLTVAALEYYYPRSSGEDHATFLDEQKNKAEWLMVHHPEACTEQLLAVNVVKWSAFTGPTSRLLDDSLLDKLLCKFPLAITLPLVEQEGGHLDVVRFLHENRTEGCTQFAIDWAAGEGHVDVVQFLHENRTEGFSNGAIAVAAQYGDHRNGDLAMVQYLVKIRPEAIQDPTAWWVNDAVKYVRSVWAKRAIESDQPMEALRAAVVQITDVDAFRDFHAKRHPAGCTTRGSSSQYSLLKLAIEEENDKIAAYLVSHCEHARASIGSCELLAAGSESRPLNLKLLDFLMANGPSGEEANRTYTDLLLIAAAKSNLPLVKALLDRGVPCSEEILIQALYGEQFEASEYLMETYQELITTEIVRRVAYRSEHAYLFKLHASHPHLWDGSVVDEILCSTNPQAHTTWELLCSLYERCSSIPLQDRTVQFIWMEGRDDVLLFMWLVWQDPKIAPSLAAAGRGYRLRLSMRLRALVPSLFVGVPSALPWCCQLCFLRERVECGELTLADMCAEVHLHEQPYYAAIPLFKPEKVLEMVCKQGSVQLPQLLQDKLGVVASGPSHLLRVTLEALGRVRGAGSDQDETSGRAIPWPWPRRVGDGPVFGGAASRGVTRSVLVAVEYFSQTLRAEVIHLTVYEPFFDGSERFDVSQYLLETYPALITTDVLRKVACRGEHAYLFKLQDANSHLWDGSVVGELLGSANAVTWELLCSLYERCSSTPLESETILYLWSRHDDMLLFLWLVWQDPTSTASLAAADRELRLRVYSRLRELAPSLFVDVPVTLPWCCQLRFLRQRVESGELTQEDVERARSETASLS